ncbi:sporulation protein YunB [Lederbergia wuyishanensis]|uniref:Sporulation protein YunB n=1 Tax=Lederbergia wuyishanensis TaxID=1347903 RepID=A0ABU0D960_9BACI|nr:sporulation protein YunB [Lederbergia wuyishanensis]MCJ8009436.1 sporulation protein YunB [Lederbergia wuyishanensis]MDQ0344954.1 sporulation protein YunB [Lederbergia wuyishanensis]
MAVFRVRKVRRGPLPFRYVMLLSFVFFIFSTALGLWIVNTGIKPTLISYAESQTNKIAPAVISKAVQDVLPNVKDLNDVAEILPNGAVKYKTDIINKTQADLSRAIQLNLKQAEKGNLETLQEETGIQIDYHKSSEGEGIVYSFPIGQATKNALLGNLGPRIPIRFTPIGSVRSSVESKVEQYPINNLFVTIIIPIEVSVQIIIPFGSEKTVVKQEVPLAIGIFPQAVPDFYNGNGTTNPSIQFPANPD